MTLFKKTVKKVKENRCINNQESFPYPNAIYNPVNEIKLVVNTGFVTYAFTLGGNLASLYGFLTADIAE